MSVAEHVVPGRCACCGHKLMTWTPQTVIDAALAHKERTGVAPFAREWKAGTPEHPSATTVLTLFGGWNRMLAAASLSARPRHAVPYTRKQAIDALRAYKRQFGWWPTMREWDARQEVPGPCGTTIVKLFGGSWRQALQSAAGSRLPRQQRRTRYTREQAIAALLDWVCANGRWPSEREWKRSGVRPGSYVIRCLFGSWTRAKTIAAGHPPTAKHKFAVVRADRRCAGCGCPLAHKTLGCPRCSSRHWNYRNRRSAARLQEAAA